MPALLILRALRAHRGSTVKDWALATAPAALVIVIGPDVAPVGMVVITICVDFTVNVAAVP